jgi:hypothetical protein
MLKRKRPRRSWTAGEVRDLRKMAGKIPAGRIARKLKRTTAATRYRAHLHGISLAA